MSSQKQELSKDPIGLSKEREKTVDYSEKAINQDICLNEVNKNSDDNSEASADKPSSLQLDDFNIDNSLEEKLKKHGLNRRNAKTIIRELLNNESVRGLLQANLENSDLSFLPEPKQLRSRKKNASTEKLKFTELPLSDDDEEDDEYHPEESIELDTTLDTEASQDTRAAAEPPVPEHCDDSDDSFMAKLQQCNDDIEAIHQNSEKEIIALRTRSKHSLLDIAMVEIETAFKPPDVSEDMYQPSGDDDWHKWLAELMLDDNVLQQPEVIDDDEDPDYNFLLSDTEDANDCEDFRTDPATHIPKQEVQVLLQERQLPTVTYQGQLQAQNLHKSKPTRVKACFSSSVTVREKLNSRKKKIAQLPPDVASPTKSQIDRDPAATVEAAPPPSDEAETNLVLRFTGAQIEAMQTQLRQHVQLLVQMNLLSRNKSALSFIQQESHVMLEELQRLEKHDEDSFGIPSSYFKIPYLSEALDVVRLNIKKSEPLLKTFKPHRNRGNRYLPLERNVAVVMATTPLFAYSHLLPPVAPPDSVSENSRLVFNLWEDNLLVLGLNQMQNHLLPWSTLIHRYMMPCKLPDQIKTRFSNSYVRSDAHNPIRLYKKTRALPSPPALGQPYIGANLLESTAEDLPEWVITLREELQDLSKMRRSRAGAEKTQAVSLQPNQNQLPVRSPPSIIGPVNSIVQSTSQSSATCSVTPSNLPKKTPTHSVAKKKLKNSISSLSKTKSKRKSKPSEKRKLVEETLKDSEQPVCKISNVSLLPSSDCDSKAPSSEPQTSRPASPARAINESIEKPPTPPQTRDPIAANPTSPCETALLKVDEVLPPSTSDVTRKIDEDHVIDEEDDEVASTEDDDDEEIDFQLNEGADELSEEEDAKKQTAKKKKELKVKWRSRSKNKQLGGRLHRLHPGLMGKKKSKTSEDSLSKSLRESAEKVKMLEEETIVQLDPLGVEKEILFAQGYLKRMEEALADKPDVFVKVLEIMSEFENDISQSPPALFKKLSKILEPWPELIQGFAPFLMPEQAHKCGLFAEQQVYARARKFLRQLEIRFSDNSQQLTRVLNTFKAIAETGVYREQELKNSVLSLLKCDPYLQEEFLMFFDDERPPESRLHGDYEEIMWSDDLIKDSHPCEFEQVRILNNSSREHTNTGNDAVTDPVRSPARQGNSKSPRHATAAPDDGNERILSKKMKSDVKGSGMFGGGLCSSPCYSIPSTGDTTWEELRVTDTEEGGGLGPSKEVVSVLPDIALISEDALSCSPFKRHNPPSSPTDVRPCTPRSGLDTTPDEISLSSQPPSQAASSTLGSSLPLTPTGSKSSVETAERRWTFEDDNVLLCSCKEHGPTEAAFQKISATLQRPKDEVRVRFQHLMSLLSGKEQTDTDTTSHYTDSESEMSVEE